ncbi:MAG: hypothetical protein LUE15_04305 [Oscillospiraceae bacterium]|nr:hypothetical protein [Oscillospiraceae bacterium]
MENTTLELLDMLYTMVTEAWGVPLGNEKCIIERDKAMNLLDEIKNQLPSELAEASRLVSARDTFINNAKREAEAIRKSAEDKAKEMVEEQEIVRAARVRAAEITTAAEKRSKGLYRVANEYVDDALRRTEEAINTALNEVHTSRASFRSVAEKPKKAEPARKLTPAD